MTLISAVQGCGGSEEKKGNEVTVDDLIMPLVMTVQNTWNEGETLETVPLPSRPCRRRL